jgi:glycosyltransferase involved in cell wall biosynthesis
VPALNESARIASVVRSTLSQVEEVVVVDDGSTDETAAEAERAGALVIRHSRNWGKTAALQTGFDHALAGGFDVVITLDGDAQHLPEEIPLLLATMQTRAADLVSGDRMTGERNMPGSRRFVNRLSSQISTWIAGRPLLDCHCGFRAINTRVLEKVRLRSPRYAGDTELVIWACFHRFKVEHAEITSVYQGEESGIRPVLDTVNVLFMALRAILARFYWDLRS